MSGYSPAFVTLETADRPRLGAVEVRPLAALLLPSFCAAVFAVTLVQVLLLSQSSLFADTDTGWHLRTGEAILQTGAIPRVDPFSYTLAGKPWFAWEWLSDVLLGGTHQVAGPAGVAMFAALLIALTAWGVARLTLSLGGNFFFTAAAMVLLLGTTGIHWLARPHIFSWLLSLLFLSIAEHERRRPGRALYVLPLAACLWANLHGSFLLGPAILFIYAVGEWLGGWRRHNGGRRFAAVCLISLPATFINPYGWRLHQHVVAYLNDDFLMDHIQEFRSFDFHAAGSLYVELFLLVAVVGIAALLRQRAFGPALLALGMLHMALYSARHLPTAAVLLLPLCVAALTREARAWARFRPLLDYSERLRAIDQKVWGAVPVILVLTMTFAGLSASARDGRGGFNSPKLPAGAADFIAKHHPGTRVFATDQWGGFLIYRFNGRQKVFIDGRSDFYGRQFLETYAIVAEAKPGWDVVLNHYDVRLVLIPPDTALASVLQLKPGWKRVYTDPVATVFQRIEA
jgi:hypothetical protein